MAVDEVARTSICNLEKNMDEGFKRIDTRLVDIGERSEEMFNHMSERPTKTQHRTILILTAIVTTLLTIIGTFSVAFLFGGS